MDRLLSTWSPAVSSPLNGGAAIERVATLPAHQFHIPVMGTGFTIATPLKVARYGISSVISLVDDVLIEQVRQRVGREAGRDCAPIEGGSYDARARRITAYLDLVDELVQEQVERLRDSAFEMGSEITHYYQMLPPSPLKSLHEKMQHMAHGSVRDGIEAELRRRVTPGSIDVNIMTKVDRDPDRHTAPGFSDALSALRGFARSRVSSSVVLSAGLNRRLFAYLGEFDDFFPDPAGDLRKKIILKVSDFRSAIVQGKLLAKKGLWVSEFRVESGLNCGGHAFGEKGQVLGPILDQFRRERSRLVEQLHSVLQSGLESVGRARLEDPLPLRLTVQGGIGSAEEATMLREVYGVDATGWGSPFLLVPEVVSIDPPHLDRVARAREEDVQLSDNSPLGIPFWSLRTSASETSRLERIARGRPGSACPKGFIRFNTDFTDAPICTASRAYQKRRLEEIDGAGLAPEVEADEREQVLTKSCICHELSGGAVNDAASDEPDVQTAVCCGPNTVYFSKVATLREMVDHIYGRRKLPLDPSRPHMFLKELSLHVTRLAEQVDRRHRGLRSSTEASCRECADNLLESIDYYRREASRIAAGHSAEFLARLGELRSQLEQLRPGVTV